MFGIPLGKGDLAYVLRNCSQQFIQGGVCVQQENLADTLTKRPGELVRDYIFGNWMFPNGQSMLRRFEGTK